LFSKPTQDFARANHSYHSSAWFSSAN